MFLSFPASEEAAGITSPIADDVFDSTESVLSVAILAVQRLSESAFPAIVRTALAFDQDSPLPAPGIEIGEGLYARNRLGMLAMSSGSFGPAETDE